MNDFRNLGVWHVTECTILGHFNILIPLSQRPLKAQSKPGRSAKRSQGKAAVLRGKQRGASEDEHSTTKQKTPRKKIRARTEAVELWQILVEMLKPQESETSRKSCNRTSPLATMLRIDFLKNGIALADLKTKIYKLPNHRQQPRDGWKSLWTT
jgi:hypothetical protein